MKNNTIPEGQPMGIAVRAYVCKPDDITALVTEKTTPRKDDKKKLDIPSEWVLVFDTETATDASQKLRLGSYQVRKGDKLDEIGLFYDPETLTKTEQKMLKDYAEKHNLKFLTVAQFVDDIFYGIGYERRATIVGFNLPFDISRLALDHSPARANKWNKVMRGGFSFKLSENHKFPRVQIKHVSSRDAFIQFVAPKRQRTGKGDRKKERFQSVRRGFFIDLKTLAAALTSQSYSLKSLAQFLNVVAQKHETQDHGGVLTPEYIAYAAQDTQSTWECYLCLQALYKTHDFKLTAAHNIHSEASVGKAYLKDMGIAPWRKMQPDFPADLLGIILSTYYGGRSEIHIRKEKTQILYCDFLSMYPTVCTLMGLWRFVTAQGMTWEDTTEKTQEFLDQATLSDLQCPETWQSLCTLVQVLPDGDIFPVRAKYDGDAQYTIGSNHLTREKPLWFTLADCISAKLLTGRAPKILKAVSFMPGEIQEGLKPVYIAGNSEYRVDPAKSDFFKRVIDLRGEVKKKMKDASDNEQRQFKSQQTALKLVANATSYGIFVELNVEEENNLQSLLCYGPSGKAISIEKKKFEATGSFFHPLLGTLITGAARLMLAITERQAIDAGIDWAFCDTDSMALAKPESMDEDEFYARARKVQEWFTPLNPYVDKSPLLKIEDHNYRPHDKEAFEPLYCYAVSSKRYALFNMDAGGKPILRKVSAHGLGHLIAPYSRKDESALEETLPWQHDTWQEIIEAALENRQPDLLKLENFNMPAVSRYGATTPQLLKWFDGDNKDKPYRDRVRPFNFLNSLQAKPQFKHLKPVAPYNKNPAKASTNCFDRAGGEKVRKNQLKTYHDAMAQYHLHPETKFLNGDYTDKGRTRRRHVIVKSVQHIGKEANKWEEQFVLGYDPDAQIEYGIAPEQKNEMLDAVLQAIKIHGARRLAEVTKLTEQYVLKICKGEAIPSEKTIAKLYRMSKIPENESVSEQELLKDINEIMKAKNFSIRWLATKLEIDASNLAKILSGRRSNADQLSRVYAYLINH